MSGASTTVKPRGRLPIVLLLVALAAGGCDDDVTTPDGVFGETGTITVDVRSPIGVDGRRDEILIWASNGPWRFTERVSYGGQGGAETNRSSRLNPGDLAREYASLIVQLNQTPGIRVLDGTVPQDVDPECGEDGLPPTRVTLIIKDDLLGEEARWVRCAEGTLLPPPGNTISPGTAAPDAGAARVVTAAQLTTSFTLGDGYVSTYGGTHPFAFIEQGEDSPARREASQSFVSADGQPPPGFLSFWEDHASVGTPLPNVDWENEIVLVAAVGLREEVGEALVVRRVLPLGPASGTRVEITERVPGDFCTPLARDIYPYQIVVLPAEGVHLPIQFAEPQLERIPCGS